MNDAMNQREDFAVKLECGHPNKHAGQHCELCGQTVPGDQITDAAKPAVPAESASPSEPATPLE